MAGRCWARGIVVLMVLAWVAGGSGAIGASLPPQAPEQLDADLGKGITWEPLAWGDAELPAEGQVRFERMVVEGFSSTSLWETIGPELLVVETGNLVVVDDRDGETRYGPSRSPDAAAVGFQMVMPETLVGVRNDDPEPATFLRLSLASPPSMARRAWAANINAATRVLDGVPVPPPFLLEGEVADTADAPSSALLFIGVVTWSGETMRDSAGGPYQQDGFFGLVVDTGEIEIAAPDGSPGRLAAGDCLLLPPQTAYQFWNPAAETAKVFVVGALVDPDGPPLFASSPDGTPATGGDLPDSEGCG